MTNAIYSEFVCVLISQVWIFLYIPVQSLLYKMSRDVVNKCQPA